MSIGIDLPPQGFSRFDIAFQGIRKSIKNNESLINECSVFEGLQYPALSSDYAPYFQAWRNASELHNIFLSFGGTDVADFSLKFLDRFNKIDGNFCLTISVGPGSRNFQAVKNKALQSKRKVTVKQNVPCLPKFMVEIDLAITTAGLVTLSELALTYAPSILVAAVDHQTESANHFSPFGGFIHCAHAAGKIEEDFDSKLLNLAQNPRQLSKLSQKWKGLVDHNGIQRMVAIIEEHIRKNAIILFKNTGTWEHHPKFQELEATRR